MKLVYLNYKLPLKPVEGGHGYDGTLAQTEDGAEIQCHICGGLYANLGIHAFFAHGIKAKEYRERFHLGRTTPLCSDRWSEHCKQKKAEAWASMSESDKESRRDSMRQAQRKAVRIGNPRSLESLNKDGMCPDQLIEKLVSLQTKLGKSPSYQDFVKEYEGKYTGAIIRTFGSWNGAKKMANLESNKPGSTTPHNKGVSKYTDEILLDYLRNHYQEKGTVPTYSDWKRGFLPDYHLYLKRFGSIVKARELAGLSPVKASAGSKMV